MEIKKVMPKLSALIAIAMLASGGTVFAEDGENVLSGYDVLDQAVALYEKLQRSEVQIPEPLMEQGIDEHLLKSVVLGYVNLDETEALASAPEVSKQDVMTILYKTIINYDSSYAISEEEADNILNDCYDNAYIDEENRLAYAFMIKQGIISNNSSTEPDKALTWDSCRILVDLIYDYFIQETTVTVNDTPVTMGANVETILEAFGEPNRIDESDYGFKWYVYNSDYTRFVMIGVEGDRICAVYTNSSSFEYNGIKSGDLCPAVHYVNNSRLRLTINNEDRVDSLLYNPRADGQDDTVEINKLRSKELLDIINAYRVRQGLNTYVFSDELADTAWLESMDYIGGVKSSDAFQAKGYDIFYVYENLLRENSPLLTEKVKENIAAGISAPIDSAELFVSVVVDDSVQIKRTVEQVDASELPKYSLPEEEVKEEKLLGFIPVANAEKNEEEEKIPIKVNSEPRIEETDASQCVEGDDLVLNIEERTADKYRLEVYDIEAEEYAVNSYIATEDTQLSVSSDLLTPGCDYLVTVSSVAEDGTEYPSEEQVVSYGSVDNESAVKIISPVDTEEYTTDNDYIALQWESDIYHDFYIDVYNSTGDLVVSSVVEDDDNAIIRGIDPGDYYVYVTALRRGTFVEKAQDMVAVHVNLPEPVVNEYIIDKEDKYYFVYEDSALGVLYFYDEELVDVEEAGELVQKKKIIQKQVKATKAYRNLAQYQRRAEYTTGDPTIHYISESELGQAIVDGAMQYLGVPYVWGGTTPEGFDCSGLVQYVLRDLGVEIARVTYDQVKEGIPVTKSELAPGDLVFFAKNGDIHHVGIYIGNDEFIHAPRTGDVIKISSLNEEYYTKEYYGARRIY